MERYGTGFMVGAFVIVLFKYVLPYVKAKSERPKVDAKSQANPQNGFDDDPCP